MIAPALRRALSLLVALTLAVVLPVALTGRHEAVAAPKPVKTAMRSYALEALPATARAEVAPGAPAAQAAQTDPEARTAAVELGGRAHVVGVTWDRGSVARGASAEIRERRDGAWGPWQALDTDAEEGPDPGSEGDTGVRDGTAPWISTADAVQVRVLGDTKGRGRAARFDVVDATTTSADAALTSGSAGTASAAATTPTIYTRAQWGADESIRRGSPSYGQVRAAVVHHTVGSNSYTADQVPSIIRGIYAFHVNGRGWNDIGYNFLVDRFGRAWEGRYGGTTQAVVGAHSQGVNSQTTGTSVLGTFETTTPPSAVVTAQAKLIAWKLGLAGVDPTATTSLDGKGTQRTVIGHRDVFSTECPGQRLYDALGSIRSKARAYQGTMVYGPSVSRTSYGYGGGGVTVTGTASDPLTWRLTVTSVCRTSPQVTLTGTASGALRAAWDGRFGNGSYAPPGDYRVELTASSGSGELDSALPVSWSLRIGSATGAPAGYCPPRIAGANRFAVAAETARTADPGTRKVVVVNGTSEAMADALVAASYARRSGAVLLLTNASSLPAETVSEIRRRGATSAVVVGGPVSVRTSVMEQLRDLGLSRTRVGGDTRYDVAANVARLAAGGSTARDVFVASGEDRAMADGLVLSAPAVALRRPVLLVRSDSVPDATRQALAAVGAQRSVVAGGTTTVSDDVLAALPSATRVGGANRYALSANVATWAAQHGVSRSSVVVSSGEPDSLADTLSGGQLGRPTLYVRKTYVPSDVNGWLRDNTGLDLATVLGGTDSVELTTGGTVQRAVLQ